MDWLNSIADALARSDVRGIVIALLISWGGTQLLKNAPTLLRLSDRARVLRTRLIAFVLAAVPTTVLWPYSMEERILLGIALGVASPTIYTTLARTLYHFFPWLEVKMSAVPAVPVDEVKDGT